MGEAYKVAENIDELKDQVQKIIERGESNPDITGNELLREFKFNAECAVQCQLSSDFRNVLANIQNLHEDLPNINFSKERALEMLNYFVKHGTIFVGICDNEESVVTELKEKI